MSATSPGGEAEAREDLSPRDILDTLALAVKDHLDWSRRFHRSLICAQEAPRDIISDQSHFLCPFGAWLDLHRDDSLLDQAAFRHFITTHEAMHESARRLALKGSKHERIAGNEYDDFAAAMRSFFEQARRIQTAFESAKSDLDLLTGLYNRQIMTAEVSREVARSVRTGLPCALALADLDHFKAVNDTYGHGAGDLVLQTAAARFLENIRSYDMIFRYGGEEFLICLPNADLAMARTILERLRQSLESEPVVLEDGRSLKITSSFGLTIITGGEATLKEIIAHADEALYAAKNAGRNTIRLWQAGSVV